MDADAARGGAVSWYDGGTAFSANQREHVADRRLAGLEAERPRDDAVGARRRTCPGSTAPSSDSRTWQMLVPMIATSVPGSVTVVAGTETWASTLATATASPA